MKKHLLLSLILGLLCCTAVIAQKAERVEVPNASVSIVPTSFLIDKHDNRFSASGDRFGGIAFLTFTPAVDMGSILPGEADVKAFEEQIKTSAMQKVFSDAIVKGMHDSGLGSFIVQKSDSATFNSLPAIRVEMSGTIDQIAYRATSFAVFNPKLKKLYTVSWMCDEKHFEDFSKSLQPALDSIEFK